MSNFNKFYIGCPSDLDKTSKMVIPRKSKQKNIRVIATSIFG